MKKKKKIEELKPEVKPVDEETEISSTLRKKYHSKEGLASAIGKANKYILKLENQKKLGLKTLTEEQIKKLNREMLKLLRNTAGIADEVIIDFLMDKSPTLKKGEISMQTMLDALQKHYDLIAKTSKGYEGDKKDLAESGIIDVPEGVKIPIFQDDEVGRKRLILDIIKKNNIILNNNINKYNYKIEKQDNKINFISDKNSDKNISKKEENREVNRLKKIIEDNKNIYEKIFKNYEENEKLLNSEKAKMLKDFLNTEKNLRSQITNLTSDIFIQKNVNESQNKEIINLNKQKKEQNIEINKLAKEKEKINELKTEKEKEIDELKKEKEKNKKIYDEQQQIIEDLKINIRNNMKNKEKEDENISKKIKEYKQIINDLKEDKKYLEQLLDQKNIEIFSLKKEKKELVLGQV